MSNPLLELSKDWFMLLKKAWMKKILQKDLNKRIMKGGHQYINEGTGLSNKL